MSWLQALRDEFTLRPFEIEQTQSGCISMASGHQDVTTNQDPAEVMEELSGKKKSKFQMFKNFFARKKKKELPASGADVGLRASQSSENVSKASEKNTLTRSERDKGSGSKISLGSKALSHDSVFVSDSSEANEPLGASQDSIHVKVKSLQLQLKQAIRLGSPPSLMCVKKTEDTGTMSEDDGLPCSPPEYRTLHTVMVQSHSLNSLEGLDSDDDQLSCATSSRAVSPLVVPGDFSQPASSYGCLDNSAAKHKLGLRHKACYRRKPLIRLDVKADGESVVKEILNASRKLQQHVTTEVVHGDELKPQLQREDEDNEEGGQTQPLLTYKEDCDKGDDESELKHISVDLDSSPCPDPCLLVEKAPDAQPIPSDSLAASSLDSPRAMTPSCVREFLPDPPGIPHRAEEVKSNLSLTGEEATDQQNSEEEVLLLQEVLGTSPLPSSSLGNHTEGIVVDLNKGVNVKEREDVEKAQELKEERGETVVYQADPAGSLEPDQTTTEEEEVSTLSRNTRSCQDVQSEAMLDDKEEAAEEKEEDLIVEKVSQQCPEEEGEYEEGEEVQPKEQNDMITDNRINQAQEERGVEPEESEGGEDTFKLEKSPEVEEGRRDNRKEGVEEVEVNKGKTEEDETKEDERQGSEEVTEVLPDAAVEEVEITNAMQNMDEGEDTVVEDDTVLASQVRNKNELPLELADQAIVDEIESCVEESVIGEEREVEGDHLKPNAEVKEEDVEPNKPGSDPTEQDVEQEGVKVSSKNMMQMEHEKTEATEQSQTLSKASFSFPEPQHETQSQESGTSTTSNTGRTMLHINRLSPSSEKEETSNCKQDSEVPSCAAAFPKKEPDDTVKKVKEETPSSPHDVAPPAASEEETVKKPSSGSYQTRFHFPSLPVEGAKDNLTPASSASVCAPAAPASTEQGPALLKGNNNNPFGVWLRKTPVLHRFSSEEQNSQHSFEAPAQPYSSQTDLTQPISAKPPSNKPALPKKPDLHGDRGAKIKHISDPASTPGVSSEPDSPSWISVAIQKQKIYKDNSLNETTVKKEEPEMKNSNNSKTAESTDKEMSNPIESVDKEVRRAVSPSALMPSQPSKSQSYGLSNPVHLKPHVPVTFNKLPQRSFSAPSQVHVHQKSPPCASPLPLSNVSTYSKTPDPMGSALISPPFSSRNAPEKSSSRATGLSNQVPSSHRFLPPPAFTQDEPPWMALAKKKAKAWSEMPQIVQ